MSNFSDLYSFNSSMTVEEIDRLRSRLIHNISDLNIMKAKMQSSDFTQLMNYHQYCLDIFNNMINTRKIMESDTYAPSTAPFTDDLCVDNPVRGRKTIVYNNDGTTRIVGENDLCTKNEEWERQFSPSLLQNPPLYNLPPSNVWNIRQARNYR